MSQPFDDNDIYPTVSPKVREILPRRARYAVSVSDSPGTPQSLRGQEQLMIKKLNELYAVPDPVALGDYLTRHTSVSGALISAWQSVERVWGKDVRVNLDVVADPDGPPYETLVAHIQTQDDVKSATEKLNLFDEVWWSSHSDEVRNELEFDVEGCDGF